MSDWAAPSLTSCSPGAAAGRFLTARKPSTASFSSGAVHGVAESEAPIGCLDVGQNVTTADRRVRHHEH